VRSPLAILIWFAALSRLWAGSHVREEFPFRLREGLVWISVTVPGADRPLNFLFDTGAQVSVLDLATARRLHLALGARVAVRGVETLTEGFWPQSLRAMADGVVLPSTFLALDLSNLSRACKEPLDGLIGADFLRGRIVQIDYKARRIRVLGSDANLARARWAPIDVRRCGMRIQVRVNDGPAHWFRIDTGCATPLQWVNATVGSSARDAKIAVGLTRINIPQVRAEVNIGGYVFRNVRAGIHPRPIFPGEFGLVGNGLLSRFGVVTFDARSGRLLLGREEWPNSCLRAAASGNSRSPFAGRHRLSQPTS
jgi:Aspartyl protease